MIGGEAAAAVEQLRAAVDALLAMQLCDDSLPELIGAIEMQRRRLEAVDQRLLAHASEAAMASRFGQPGLADVIGSLLRVDPREARARVNRARDLGARRSLLGEPLSPLLPEVAAAVERGAVSAAQADVIVDCVEALPPGAPAAAQPIVERVLVQAAAHEAPRALRRTAAELLARLDPDGVEPIEERAKRRRGFTLVKRPDGTSTPRGVWTPELTAFWEPILDSLAAPLPSEDGQPDSRSAAQRRHDAMLEAAARVLRSASLPATAGVPVTVLATTTIDELAATAGYVPPAAPETPAQPTLDLAGLAEGSGLALSEVLSASSSGLALLGHGQAVSARSLLVTACEARLVPVVFNDAGAVVAFGDGRRLASRAQRLALVARDGGCCFPGCDRPAAWTEVHHVIPWAAGGPTDVDNMCLLCAFHHREFEDAGWEVIMEEGVPIWIPPPWVDPQRGPRRNTVHHLPEIDFRPASAA